MGFSVRVAPGVRVRASSRGLRTSLGSGRTKVHVGAGRRYDLNLWIGQLLEGAAYLPR